MLNLLLIVLFLQLLHYNIIICYLRRYWLHRRTYTRWCHSYSRVIIMVRSRRSNIRPVSSWCKVWTRTSIIYQSFCSLRIKIYFWTHRCKNNLFYWFNKDLLLSVRCFGSLIFSFYLRSSSNTLRCVIVISVMHLWRILPSDFLN